MSDASGEISRRFEVTWPLVRMNRRVTYVIDPELRIAAAFHHEVAVGKHDDEVRGFLRERIGLGSSSTGGNAPAP